MPPPHNVRKPAIRVSHSNLKRWNDDSPYKSICPVCEKGPLLVCRDQTTFRLINVDRCLGCGQMFVYTDEIIGGEPVAQLDKAPN